MKDKKTRNFPIISVLLLSAMLITTTAVAQKTSINKITQNKYALQNLIAGIHSENDGVKRSAVYLAGKYKIAEVEMELIDQLREEKDARTRILIALVLYEMGSTEGLLEVQKLAHSDIDSRVKRMATHIYNEYLINDTVNSVTFNK